VTANEGLPDATRLALDRTRLAYERTLMAWTRTATSLISFGFTIYKFFEYVRQDSPATDTGLGPRGFALLMIAIGLGALALATIEHQRRMRALQAEYGAAVRHSLAAVVAASIAVLGVAGLLTVLLKG
jgi:putative membrane protein